MLPLAGHMQTWCPDLSRGSFFSLPASILEGCMPGLPAALRMLYNREDAEDSTQEILVRIVTRLSQFDSGSKLKTWAYRIAKNYILDGNKSAVEEIGNTFFQPPHFKRGQGGNETRFVPQIPNMPGGRRRVFPRAAVEVATHTRYAPELKLLPCGSGDYTVLRMTYRCQAGWSWPLAHGPLVELAGRLAGKTGTDTFFDPM
jgi:hypothetical protein